MTRSVHEAGGRIFLQLWHVGRISDPSFHDGAAAGGAERHRRPRAGSACCAPERPYVDASRPDHRGSRRRGRGLPPRAPRTPRRPGFDGVELHGANGYLLDQFLQDGTNHAHRPVGRAAIENRARLLLEATDAAISVWGADRVGMHWRPRRRMQRDSSS